MNGMERETRISCKNTCNVAASFTQYNIGANTTTNCIRFFWPKVATPTFLTASDIQDGSLLNLITIWPIWSLSEAKKIPLGAGEKHSRGSSRKKKIPINIDEREKRKIICCLCVWVGGVEPAGILCAGKQWRRHEIQISRSQPEITSDRQKVSNRTTRMKWYNGAHFKFEKVIVISSQSRVQQKTKRKANNPATGARERESNF